MKKNLSLFIAITMLISMVPFVAFAADTTYGLSGNPIVINATTSAFYEMENYPIEDTKLTIKEDADSSGGKYLYNSGMASDKTNTLVTLSIDTEEIYKIKIFARMKRTVGDGGQARVVVAKNNETMIERPFYYRNGREYMWVCLDSYELEKGDDFTFNIDFNQASVAVDKLFITGNIHEFPKNMDEITNEIDISYLNDYYEKPADPIATHPRLFLNNTTLPKIRENLTNEENLFAYDSVIKNATTQPKGIEFSKSVEYMLANAFLSVVEEDLTKKEEYANKSIETLMAALSVKSELKSDRKTRSDHVDRAYRIHVISLVYDWCYDYLTENIFNKMKQQYSYLNSYKDIKEYLFTEILFYLAQYEMTYPPALTHGSTNGHISEAEVFLGLLSTSLAFYDEYPEMYRVIGGKLFEESIWARNFYYEMRNHTQGSNYMSVRMANEFQLFSLLQTGVENGETLMADGADELLMEYIYGRRPDGYMFRNGDGNGPSSDVANITSLFGYSNLLKNNYLRFEVSRQYPTPTLGYNANGISDYLWLIFNDPEVTKKSYKELPLTRYAGSSSGVMYARTSWEMGAGDASDAMAVRLNLETMFGGGHDHLDAGHFDIYYKGALALDTGFYPGTDEKHHRNYFKRTIAHNAMLLYDPDEKMDNRYSGSVNDGGQKYLATTSFPTETQFKEEKKTGEILAVDYGEDMYSPSFTYMKGDLTKAYATNGDKAEVHNSEKMKKYTRSFVFLNFFDDVYPGALIVFDKMTSNNPDFKKTWLLHTQEEPTIKGGTVIASKSENGDNGRLINTTLLPKSNDRDIISIGGEGNEFNVNGINYPTEDNYENDSSKHINDFGKWRIELSPKEKKATDYFLNVLHVTENNENIPLLEPELIEIEGFAGVKIKDRVAFFGLGDEPYDEDITFTLSGDGEYEILFTDVKPGAWDVYKDESLYSEEYATDNGSDFTFKGEKGVYKLIKDTTDTKTFERNLNYLDYTKETESLGYIKFNKKDADISYFERDGLLFVEAEKLSKLIDFEYKYENRKLIFAQGGQSLSIDASSDSVILNNGKYYIDLYALRELFNVSYTNPQDNVYEVTFSKRTVVKITTGDEFADTQFNENNLYIIEGSETLNDGSKGIVLPKDYTCLNKTVKGVIKGVDNKNNIQLTSNTPLFMNTVAKYTCINNINLKGPEEDGSGDIKIGTEYYKDSGSDYKANGVLICSSSGAFDLVIKNVNNYVNMYSDAQNKSGILYTGGLIGRRTSGNTLIENCANYGKIDVSNIGVVGNTFPAVGGLVGQLSASSAGTTKLKVQNSKNFKDISMASYSAGGILGNNLGEKAEIDISLCSNYGNITSTSQRGTGGIIGACAGNTVVEKSFNAGNISANSYASGIIGNTAVTAGSGSYGTGSNSTFTVENSFNAGEITGSRIAGIVYRGTGKVFVRYCYNLKPLSGNYSKEITDVTISTNDGNYHINSEKSSEESYIAREELATGRPVLFNKHIWEYTFADESNKFSFPQIIGNTFVYTKDNEFYVEKFEISINTGAYNFTSDKATEADEKPRDTVTGDEIKTAYVIVPAKFRVSLGVAENFTYGMLISKTYSGESLTKDTASRIAKGVKNVGGAYGILFHGNMKAGDTYYVRPYVEFNDKYYYGVTTSFVFPVLKVNGGINKWLEEYSLTTHKSLITPFEY